jgi:hypothetical protein
VDEAFRFIGSLEEDPTFQPVFIHHRKDIYAGLHIFAARRLIDADQSRLALDHFQKAARFSLPTVLSVWYKVLQALGGFLGMSGAFLFYRNLRRHMQHRSIHLLVSESGVSFATGGQTKDNFIK